METTITTIENDNQTLSKTLDKIREYTEAGIILNHMYLFDVLQQKLNKTDKNC